MLYCTFCSGNIPTQSGGVHAWREGEGGGRERWREGWRERESLGLGIYTNSGYSEGMVVEVPYLPELQETSGCQVDSVQPE